MNKKVTGVGTTIAFYMENMRREAMLTLYKDKYRAQEENIAVTDYLRTLFTNEEVDYFLKEFRWDDNYRRLSEHCGLVIETIKMYTNTPNEIKDFHFFVGQVKLSLESMLTILEISKEEFVEELKDEMEGITRMTL